jgi:hypothetical protein
VALSDYQRQGAVMVKAILFTTITVVTGLQATADGQATTIESTAVEDIPSAPAEGGVRRWQVVADEAISVRATPSHNAPTIMSLANGTIVPNLGCEKYEDRVWCSIKTIRGKKSGYVLAKLLEPAAGPDGTVPLGVNDSLRRARNSRFDVGGKILCAQERGQELSECTVGVAQAGGGDATVVVSFPNGFKRSLYFVNGYFVSANTTMSGNGSDTDWQKLGDLHIIRVDDQRYELHDDLIFNVH